MSANKKILIFIVFPIIALLGFLYYIENHDPYYATNEIREATVIRKAIGTGKLGSFKEIYVKLENDEVLRFAIGLNRNAVIGEKVKLRVYRKRLLGSMQLKLEY